MNKSARQIVLLAASTWTMFTGCMSQKPTANVPSLRVSWWSSQRELYAYVVRPAVSNLCEISVSAGGRTLEGPIVNKTLPEMISMVEAAQKQVAVLPISNSISSDPIDRVLVNYYANGEKAFAVQGSIPDLLQTIHRAPALEELLFLMSRNQPKNYRMLDEPRPGGQFMKPPNADNP